MDYSAAGVSLIYVALIVSGCALHERPRDRRMDDNGLPRCPVTSATDFTAPESLQCWFAARRAMWRITEQESHYTVLVARVAALDRRDADDIAARIVRAHRREFAEILVYVSTGDSGDAHSSAETVLQPDERNAKTAGRAIRRVRWTADEGFETLDFTAPSR